VTQGLFILVDRHSLQLMTIKQAHYEELLAEYCSHSGAVALLKQFRPYLEMLPSMRRPDESLMTLPLPVIRIRQATQATQATSAIASSEETVQLPCDLAILMCDPEWKIKMEVEILVFIHRPAEDFSHLLSRWRQTQILLNRTYEWLTSDRDQHFISGGTHETYPLFVVYPNSQDRIKRGLRGSNLPFITEMVYTPDDEELDFKVSVEKIPDQGLNRPIPQVKPDDL
jgi:hypothetical protein